MGIKRNNILKQIDIISRGNAQTKKELIDIIVQQTSNDINEFNTYLQENNWTELKKLAHKMESTFIYLKVSNAIALTKFLRIEAGQNIETTIHQAKEFTNLCEELIHYLKHISKN